MTCYKLSRSSIRCIPNASTTPCTNSKRIHGWSIRGVQAMIPANMVLLFACTISGVTRDLLQAPEFIASIVQNDISFIGAILPAVIFAIAGFLSFSTGTAWGTFGILIPIVV